MKQKDETKEVIKLIEKRKEYQKNYYLNHKDKFKKYRDDNKEKIQKTTKKWDSENKIHKSQYQKEWYLKNKERIRKVQNLYESKRFNDDTLFKLKKIIGAHIRKTLKNNGCDKKSKTHHILGCSFEEFKSYLESKFESWMNWNNYGKYNGELNHGWDIDHIIPTSSAETEVDILRLNHYTNLQPLCSKINRDIKKGKHQNFTI